jgi:hypothetical protein
VARQLINQARRLSGRDRESALNQVADTSDKEGIAFRAVRGDEIRSLLLGKGIPARGRDKGINTLHATIVDESSQAYRNSAYMPTSSVPPYLIAAQGEGTNFISFDTRAPKQGFMSRAEVARRIKESEPTYKAEQYTKWTAHSVAVNEIRQDSLLVFQIGEQRYDGPALQELVRQTQHFDEGALLQDGKLMLFDSSGEPRTLNLEDIASRLPGKFAERLEDNSSRYEFFVRQDTGELVYVYDTTPVK